MPENLNKDKGRQEFTPLQHQAAVGLLISDGWLERSSKTSNARLGFSFTVKTPKLFNNLFELFEEFGNEREKPRPKTVGVNDKVDIIENLDNMDNIVKKEYYQQQHRTGFREVFTKLWKHFYVRIGDRNKHVIPRVSFLNENLGDDALGYIFACDGSRKGKYNRGFEIHCQGSGFEGACRLAIALYENFGIKAYPAFDNYQKKGVSYWVVYIPAASFNNWAPRVRNVLKETGQFNVKMPNAPKTPPRQKSKGTETHAHFIRIFQHNSQLRENLTYKVSEEVMNNYKSIQRGTKDQS
jgi:hypothetical protein